MDLPTNMKALIDQYAKDGNKDALRRLWEGQARQLMDIEQKRHEPDQIDRFKTLAEVAEYCRANMAYVDRALEKMVD